VALQPEGVRLVGDALAKSPSWQVAFNEASEELKELKRPIPVVVDDIDPGSVVMGCWGC
jgi:hypothetical protein